MAKDDLGFVALSSLKKGASGPADPKAVLAELRRIYFKTTAKTITHDFAHAIDLLKTIESEDDRERASVFMEGLAEMRKEWERKTAARPAKKRPGPPKSRDRR